MSLAGIAGKAKSFAQNKQRLDIITFTTSAQGLNQKIFPSQRFLLKVLTKMDLDDTVCDIEIRDKFNRTVLQTFTERGYYDFLYREKRVSMPYEEYQSSDIIQINLVMGRRASKSTVIGILAAYMLYLVLLLDHPQEYFGIVSSDPMDCTIMAMGESNAKKLFSKFVKSLRRSPFFRPFLLEDTTTQELRIWTTHDLQKLAAAGKAGKPVPLSNSITVRAVANSPQVRGDNNLFAILEEFAHYATSAGSTRDKPLDDTVYEAITPSISGFKNPDGTPFGKAFLISSPNGKKGKFYNEVISSYELKGKSGSLTIQAPTWEINPSISPAFLESEYHKNRSSYDQEYGAIFVEGGVSWLQDLGCFYRSVNILSLPKVMKGRIDRIYFCGIDFALSNDGTSISVCHLEPNVIRDLQSLTAEARAYNEEDFLEEFIKVVKNRYVVDYSEARYAGIPPYENRTVLLIDEVLEWVNEVYQRFPIQAGIYDQWSGAIIAQLIRQKGIKRLEMVSHTAAINDNQYKTFSQLLHSDSLVLPNDPQLHRELLGLQATDRGNGILSVEAPSGASFHDDRFDSLIRALQLCFAYHTKDLAISTLLGIQSLSTKMVRNLASTMTPQSMAKLKNASNPQSIRNPGFNNNRITSLKGLGRR